MFFIEIPLRRYGYKKVMGAGILLVTAATLMFSFTHLFAIWFILRLLVGVGDSALHYASQLWIVSSSPPERRGRYISYYGMAYGVGFSIGPLGINLLPYGQAVPFMASSAFFMLVFFLLLRIPNEMPERSSKEQKGNRYISTYRMAWFALVPSLLFGLMEATMNSNFPVYGLRIGLDRESISVLLPAIGLGSLILQLPLGIWSDRVGRQKVLMLCGFCGSLAFLAVPLAGNQMVWLFLLFMLAGGLVGSFYSLGLAYAADLLPRAILPTANVIASIQFSIGSILGPGLGGFGIEFLSPGSVFIMLGSAYMLFTLLGFRFHGQQERSTP
jgi:MFS family permease